MILVFVVKTVNVGLLSKDAVFPNVGAHPISSCMFVMVLLYGFVFECFVSKVGESDIH